MARNGRFIFFFGTGRTKGEKEEEEEEEAPGLGLENDISIMIQPCGFNPAREHHHYTHVRTWTCSTRARLPLITRAPRHIRKKREKNK